MVIVYGCVVMAPYQRLINIGHCDMVVHKGDGIVINVWQNRKV